MLRCFPHLLGLFDPGPKCAIHRQLVPCRFGDDRGRTEHCQPIYTVSEAQQRRERRSHESSNTWQQIILFLLIILGSAIFVSSAVLHVRKSAFERRVEELAERKRRRLGLRTLTFSMSRRNANLHNQREEAIASGIARGQPIPDPDPEAEYQPTFATRMRTESMDPGAKPDELTNGDADLDSEQHASGHIAFGDTPHPLRQSTSVMEPLQRRRTFIQPSGVAARSMANHPRNARPVSHESDEEIEESFRRRSGSRAKLDKYLDEFRGFVGRNSQFHHLSERERRALGGMEYDAICVLSWVVPIYFILFQLLGAIGMGAWLQINRPDVALRNGQYPRMRMVLVNMC